MLRLGKRRSTWLSCIGGCLGGKKILFEEVLMDTFFQVPLEDSVVGGLVSLTVMVKTEIFRSGECRIMLDRLWAS